MYRRLYAEFERCGIVAHLTRISLVGTRISVVMTRMKFFRGKQVCIHNRSEIMQKIEHLRVMYMSL